MGRGNTGPVYPWFGKNIDDGVPLAVENYGLRWLWDEKVIDWSGPFRTPVVLVYLDPHPLNGTPPFVCWRIVSS